MSENNNKNPLTPLMTQSGYNDVEVYEIFSANLAKMNGVLRQLQLPLPALVYSDGYPSISFSQLQINIKIYKHEKVLLDSIFKHFSNRINKMLQEKLQHHECFVVDEAIKFKFKD